MLTRYQMYFTHGFFFSLDIALSAGLLSFN
jgi:hypothetical protein